MDKISLHKLPKKEIIWMGTHRCEAHRHTYLEHPACYYKEKPCTQRVGFFDIETSNLDADFGIMLTYSILDGQTGDILCGTITKEEIDTARAGNEDRELVRACVDDLQKFDKIVGYYSKRFDVPYVRARALSVGVGFPPYGQIIHVDLYDVIKHKFKISSRRLENACRVLLGHTTKTRIDAKYWRGAMRGDEESLEYILDHNQRDVRDLKELYDVVQDYARKSDTSI